MELVPSFAAMLQVLVPVMTAPTFAMRTTSRTASGHQQRESTEFAGYPLPLCVLASWRLCVKF